MRSYQSVISDGMKHPCVRSSLAVASPAKAELNLIMLELRLNPGLRDDSGLS